jgi:hypothetical protein
MTEFEMVLMMLLIPLYGIMFYIAGKMNLFELLLKIAEEKMKELGDKEKD